MRINLIFLFLYSIILSPNFASAKSDFKFLFKELDKLSLDHQLTATKWKEFVNKVDNLCEEDRGYCEVFYMFESANLMFEKDEYQDQGQCERTKVNVEAYFRNEFPKQKQQVLNIVKKLCPEAQKIN